MPFQIDDEVMDKIRQIPLDRLEEYNRKARQERQGIYEQPVLQIPLEEDDRWRQPPRRDEEDSGWNDPGYGRKDRDDGPKRGIWEIQL